MSKNNATLVGIFVLGGFALVAAAIVFFGAGSLFEKRVPIVSFFQGSIAGLHVGAPVTFRGVRVGRVTSTGVRIDPKTGSSIIQVDMQLAPDTVSIYGAKPAVDEDMLPGLVQSGLSAQLVTESFVTGLLDVDLDFRPGQPMRRLGQPTAVAEVPTVPSRFEAIADQLQTADIAQALHSAEQAMGALNHILGSPDLAQTLAQLPVLARELHNTLATVNTQMAGLSGAGRDALNSSTAALHQTLDTVQTLAATLNKETQSTLTEARGALKSANSTFTDAGTLFNPRGRSMQEVQRTLEDLSTTAARLRDLSERLDRDPSVLIRGR